MESQCRLLAPLRGASRLNEWLGDSLGRPRVSARAGEYEWAWDPAPVPERVLWPVVRSAADLLVSRDRGQLREGHSEGAGCSWTQPHGTAALVQHGTCGNRAKVRRFHQRHRRGAAS